MIVFFFFRERTVGCSIGYQELWNDCISTIKHFLLSVPLEMLNVIYLLISFLLVAFVQRMIRMSQQTLNEKYVSFLFIKKNT